MGRRPKRWPAVANGHRLESLDQAEEIIELCNNAIAKIRRNPDLAIRYISEARRAALVIKYALENAPADDNGA